MAGYNDRVRNRQAGVPGLLRRRVLLSSLAARAAIPARAEPVPLSLFAAGTLQDALRRIEPLWCAKGRAPLRFSFAASSTLARQLEQGAQADLFLRADEPWMDYAERAGSVVPATRRTLLTTDMLLVAPGDAPEPAAPVSPDPAAAGGATCLAALLGPRGRWATGDPAHTPIGRYAEAALRWLGQWEALAPRLARAETVRVALLLVERGEAGLGIVFRSDALVSPGLRLLGAFPPRAHPPIAFVAAATPRGAGDPDARGLLEFLASPEAMAVWTRHGFRPAG
jgi:molybdate transport system substrate-binding protein